MNKRAGADCAERHARQGCKRIHELALGAVDIDEGGADRGAGNTGRKALHDACRDQPARAVRNDEKRHGPDFEKQRGENHRLAAEMIGNRTGDQQCCQEREGIDRKNKGHDHRRSSEALLVDAVKRRRCCGCAKEGCKRDGVKGNRVPCSGVGRSGFCGTRTYITLKS